MTFHDIRFPTSVSFGSHGGPVRKTEIYQLANGFEERNTAWSQSRRRYDAGIGLRSLDDISEIIAFFEARMGPLYGFLWKDWVDFKSGAPSSPVHFSDQEIGVGDDQENLFPLVKTYQSGRHAFARRITKPIHNTVQLGISGDQITLGLHYEIEREGGLIRLYEPLPEGAVLTAGFEFDVPVRFENDSLDISIAGFEAGEIPSIPIIELRQ